MSETLEAMARALFKSWFVDFDLVRAKCRGEVTSPLPALRRPSLGRVVAYFKYQSAKQLNALSGIPGTRIWQRNYYEHVIRDEESLHRIRQYILDNPMRWVFDRENPGAVTPEPENVWMA